MNALTKQLADALRSVQWDSSDCCPMCDREAVHDPRCAVALALAAFDAAKDAPDARDAEIAALKHSVDSWSSDMKEAAKLCGRTDDEYPLQAVARFVRQHTQPKLQQLHDLVLPMEEADNFDCAMWYNPWKVRNALTAAGIVFRVTT